MEVRSSEVCGRIVANAESGRAGGYIVRGGVVAVERGRLRLFVVFSGVAWFRFVLTRDLDR